jgi:hypothetical protein
VHRLHANPVVICCCFDANSVTCVICWNTNQNTNWIEFSRSGGASSGA